MKRVLALVLLAGGCTLGARPGEFAPSKSPRGAMGTIQTGELIYTGELLARRDSSSLLLTTGKVYEISDSRIKAVDFSPALKSKSVNTPRVREQMRRISRFPQGMSDDLLRRFLDAMHLPPVQGI